MTDAPSRSFDLHGPATPDSPVVLSVPHAGRDYPRELIDALRVPLAALLPLEDRHVDAIAHAARRGETMMVARRPRAWIDLNRSERERDPLVDDGVTPHAAPQPSIKLRSGLGLVPRRVAPAGELWRGRFAGKAIERRIAEDHRPYHETLGALLEAARARFGIAILIDLHSMPTLGVGGAQIVLGDRFGRAAASPIVSIAEAAARAHGFHTALNTPYAGGHILERHGAPARDVHAIQVEIDRLLYLDPLTLEPGPGLVRMAAMLRAMIDALADLALPRLAAAE
ncbi:N-formylglutamate amidohydrolase [Sphingomonas spermidinifaciens]|uniref:N-formylglutamate amidohydrolase n=1 Tax=Sphingomonas spermidinifaciens TaxID=1141889 RepID=A0A2A4B203_9SPHN|nr:N-formylglutamate amidohydrolase [Sphingomonas spermidinifaciens]PCD01819.1 N-formylglutamate amidohydrolase [Sphingomonas spermidinifaciens]